MSLSARNWAWDTGLKRDPATGWVAALTPREKLVLLCIAEYENAQKGYAYPSYSKIAERTGLSKRSVIRSVADLAECGYLDIQKYHDGSTFARNNYYLPVVPNVYREKDDAWMGAEERGQHE